MLTVSSLENLFVILLAGSADLAPDLGRVIKIQVFAAKFAIPDLLVVALIALFTGFDRPVVSAKALGLLLVTRLMPK